MSSHEGMNEGSKLIAQAKELIMKFLDDYSSMHDDDNHKRLDEALVLLNNAIDKLTSY
jgi:hypothetical protein